MPIINCYFKPTFENPCAFYIRFVIGPSIRYKRPKLILKELYYKEELHFGIRFFFTANKSFSDRLEIKPFQGYRLACPTDQGLFYNTIFAWKNVSISKHPIGSILLV